MGLLPKEVGTRPRIACELRPEGVVAARAEDARAVLTAVSHAPLSRGWMPHWHAAEPDDPAYDAAAMAAARARMISGMRLVLEAVSLKSREITLVVPDAAARVMLLEFDELPERAADALPLVRFRLKKLVPFDVEDAPVSYQIMAASRAGVQVMAAAMPRPTQTIYEAMVRDAGFEPGALLPSTLAVLAGLDPQDEPALVVNAGLDAVTTAIVRDGSLLLHRTVDLTAVGALARSYEVVQAVRVAVAYFEDTLGAAPSVLLAAGSTGAAEMADLIGETEAGSLPVREMTGRDHLAPGAASAGTPGGIPLGWLAGVRGALAN